MKWIQSNTLLIEENNIEVAILEGLNHAGEFTEIDQVFPAVNAFFDEEILSKWD